MVWDFMDRRSLPVRGPYSLKDGPYLLNKNFELFQHLESKSHFMNNQNDLGSSGSKKSKVVFRRVPHWSDTPCTYTFTVKSYESSAPL